MSRPLLAADLFCGAGGTSTGLRLAAEGLGRDLRLVAVNHWPVAIATHRENHPDARHYEMSLEVARPLELVPEGRLDLLVASPECTHFSKALGGRPVSDQSRASAWHVLRWCSDLRVSSVLVENVPEFLKWGPVDARTKRPVKSREGETFRAWVGALEGLGYRVEWRVLNAADYGDATTRERLFVQARAKRGRITWPSPTHARDGGPDLFGAVPRWRPAREIIDWSIPGESIFRRRKRLSDKTLARILAGAVRFGWPEPFVAMIRAHLERRPLPRFEPTDLAEPLLVRTDMHRSNALCVRSVGDPIPTVTTGGGLALVLPQGGGGQARPVDEPVATIATDGAHALIAPYYGTGTCQDVEAPALDVLFRMLQPHELAAAMGFPRDYRWPTKKTDATALVGNAVAVNMARALATALLGAA